jgi:ubiquitin-activating enzyme E1
MSFTHICTTTELLDKLADAKLFMIGVGAIGCEMLKNFALLNVASSATGLVTVTDPDHIEKSNLNRQFLFRHDDIGHPKAERAALAARRMHPQLNIKVQLDKVGAESEHLYDNKVLLLLLCCCCYMC